MWPVSVLYAACVRATCGLFQCCMQPVSGLHVARLMAYLSVVNGLF